MAERARGGKGAAAAKRPPAKAPEIWDVLVVGGGPAGLSAALVLGRCRHSVLVLDAGAPRNAVARGVHAYLTRDGTNPFALRALGRRELRRYGVAFRRAEVVTAKSSKAGFTLRLRSGETLRSRTLLLATGVRDRLPPIAGLLPLYGKSVHHCPFCEGWEERDKAIAVYGRGKAGCELSLKLTGWSADVVLVSDGPSGLQSRFRVALAEQGIDVREERIVALEGAGGRLRRIRFADGTTLAREAMFFTTGHDQTSDLAAQLGCGFTRSGAVRTGRGEGTCVAGLYVAGDASRDVQLAIVAAAEGAKAAVYIHHDLDEKRRRDARPRSQQPTSAAARRRRGPRS